MYSLLSKLKRLWRQITQIRSEVAGCGQVVERLNDGEVSDAPARAQQICLEHAPWGLVWKIRHLKPDRGLDTSRSKLPPHIAFYIEFPNKMGSGNG